VALGAYSDALSSVLAGYSSAEVIKLDLTDFQSEAVITILRFLYTTELHLDCNTVGQVLQVQACLFFSLPSIYYSLHLVERRLSTCSVLGTNVLYDLHNKQVSV